MTRKSLKERIGLVNGNPSPDPVVEVRIPDGDRGRELVREMSEGFAAAQTLLSERNMYQSRSQAQHREIVYLRNVVSFHQGEAAYWRAQAMNLVKANGELNAVLNGIEQQFAVAKRAMQHVEAVNEQMDKPAPLSITPVDEGYAEPLPGMERPTAALFDCVEGPIGTALAQQAAPQPTLDEVAALAGCLSNSEA